VNLLSLLLPSTQVFTNDAFYASNHRVLKSSGIERYSRAFFFNPSFKADIAPSPGLTIAGVLPEGSGFSPMCVLWGGQGAGAKDLRKGGATPRSFFLHPSFKAYAASMRVMTKPGLTYAADDCSLRVVCG
jgi:hypothetical protein